MMTDNLASDGDPSGKDLRAPLADTLCDLAFGMSDLVIRYCQSAQKALKKSETAHLFHSERLGELEAAAASIYIALQYHDDIRHEDGVSDARIEAFEGIFWQVCGLARKSLALENSELCSQAVRIRHLDVAERLAGIITGLTQAVHARGSISPDMIDELVLLAGFAAAVSGDAWSLESKADATRSERLAEMKISGKALPIATGLYQALRHIEQGARDME